MEYCIYRDELYDDEKMSTEHIIPLSLGGHDNFTIRVNRNANSIIGSKVDGALINEFTMKLKQVHNGFAGHSKKTEYRFKNCNSEGRPLSLTFRKEGMEVYDPINRTVLNNNLKMEMRTSLKLDTSLKFVSKVALATGYYLFDEVFRNYAEHEPLREIIFADEIPKKLSGIRFYDRFMKPRDEDKADLDFIKFFFKSIKGSGVIFSFSDRSFIVHVGVGSEYIGTVNFKADIDKFPIHKDEFRLGHVIICEDEGVYQDSYWKTIYTLNKKMGLVDIDDSQSDM